MRGDIYRLKDNPHARGHEQRGTRFAVVLQSDTLLSSTVIAAPTSTSARPAVHRPEIELLGERTRVLVEQLLAIDPERRFGKTVGQVSAEELAEIDEALRRVLGLLT